MHGTYVLAGKVPIRCDDMNVYGTWLESADRTVKKWQGGNAEVSTVFLGFDHRFGNEGPPILFETMVFGGPLDQEQDRYSTWDEACAGHDAMVGRVIAASGGAAGRKFSFFE